MLIQRLISTQKRKMVHFGLDLYIILLSGQRYLADYEQISLGLKTLLKKNERKETNSLDLTFTMMIGKTNTRQ